MSYEKLTEKVRQAEQALEARERTVTANWRMTKDTWKEAWTPGRIATVGAIAGFMYGWRRQRGGGSGGDGLLRIASSMIALVSSLQAKSAANEVEDVAQTAEHSVASRTAAAAQPEAAAAPAPQWSDPPTAAAAATEISEP